MIVGAYCAAPADIAEQESYWKLLSAQPPVGESRLVIAGVSDVGAI
jgi:hypothetical protein